MAQDPIMLPIMRPVMRNVMGGEAIGPRPLKRWDFTKGQTHADLTLNTSVAGAIARDSLEYVPSGTLRQSEMGLLSEIESTNKCTNTNMKMVDTSGTAPDAAWTTHEVLTLASWPSEIRDAMPNFTPDKIRACYHSVSNGAGNISISGVTGNANTHTPSVWVYIVSGNISPAVTGGTNSYTSTTGQWLRIENPQTTVGAGSTMNLACNTASEWYWFGNQLEEQVNRTSTIETQGSTVTRLGDSVKATLPAAFDMDSFIVSLKFRKFIAAQGSDLDRTTHLYDSTFGAALQDYIIGTSQIERLTDTTAIIDAPAYTLNTNRKRAWGAEGLTLRAATDGVEDTGSGAGWIHPAAPYDELYIGVIVNDVRQLNGYIQAESVWGLPATSENVKRVPA